jgi:Flp pilus assembly protein TadG
MPDRRRLRQRQDGAAAVEFALILVVLVSLLFGMIQYGLYFYSSQTGSSVASEALRQLSVGNCQVAGSLSTLVNKNLQGAKTGPATATPTFKKPDGTSAATLVAAGVGGSVSLQIVYPTLNLHFPFVPFLSDSTITKTVQAQIEDTTSSGCI